MSFENIFDGFVDQMMNVFWIFTYQMFEAFLLGIYDFALKIMTWNMLDAAAATGATPNDFIDGGVATGSGFLYGMPNLSAIFDTIMENAVIPIAIIVFAFFVISELVQLLNNSSATDFDMSIFIKWTIKTCISLFILLNANVFVNGIFALGGFMATQTVTAFGNDVIYAEREAILARNFFTELLYEANVYGDNADGLIVFIPLCFLGVVLLLTTLAAHISVYVVLLNRMFEMVIYSVVAPIPLATFANSEFNQIGKNYLKNLGALALQGFLIAFIFIIYQSLILLQISEFAQHNNFWLFNGSVMMCIVYSVVLIIMMFKTSTISKAILNAG